MTPTDAGSPPVRRQLSEALRDDARVGLTSTPKWLPPKWFYDARGSELFEQITALPEYYPTRTERALLAASRRRDRRRRGARGPRRTRVRVIGEDGAAARRLHSRTELWKRMCRRTSHRARSARPRSRSTTVSRLAVHGVVRDFTETLHHLPRPKRWTANG